MSESPNSTSDSTSTPEEVADLTLNQDEVLDLELALGALGGMRHSRACDAAERSTRRFDERNHRLHESRMKSLGMEGEEKEPEDEDMGQQVLIRSPVNHHYHYPAPPNGSPPSQPTQPQQPQAPSQPTAEQPKLELSPTMKALIAALLGSSLLGPAIGGYALYRNGGTVINQPIEKAAGQNIGTLPPIPPDSER